MAAPCARMLVAGRLGGCWGTFVGTVSRNITSLRTQAAGYGKSLHTRSPLCEQSKREERISGNSTFIAGAKARNPMKAVGVAWAIGFPSGILLFLLAKNKVDKRRLEQMKARQRMRDANKGEYKSERFNKAVERTVGSV